MTSDNSNNHANGSIWRGGAPTTADLLEAAVLDSMGMLDAPEADAYAAALRNAPEHIRAMVLDEQARLAVLEELLPDIDPPAELRARVIEAVRQEIAQTKPSPARPTTVQHAAGRATPGAPKLIRARRVHPAWRAAAVGFAVAVVALGAVQLQLQGSYQTFRSEASIAQLIDTVGVANIRDTLLEPTMQRFYFQAEGDATPADALAALWVNPDSDEARLYCYRLPQGASSTFRVVRLDDAGEPVETLATFRSGGLLDAVPVSLGDASEMKLAIIMDRADGSTRLMTADVRRA
jgi:hypothetical protein